MHEVTRDTALLRGLGIRIYGRLSRLCDQDHARHACRSRRPNRLGGGAKPARPRRLAPRHQATSRHFVARRPASAVQPWRQGAAARFWFHPCRQGALRPDRGTRHPAQNRSALTGRHPACHRRRRSASRRPVSCVRTAGTSLPPPPERCAALIAPRPDYIVILTGYVPEDDVAGWFNASIGVVLPYQRTEQSGVASLANAFGVPVLASKVGGLAEQYATSPWLFPPRNPQELASVLASFIATAPQERALSGGPLNRGRDGNRPRSDSQHLPNGCHCVGGRYQMCLRAVRD